MKQKIIQILLVCGILSVPLPFIFKEDTDLSIRYIAIIFSLLSTLLSLVISSGIFKFVYKIFIKLDEETYNEMKSLFLAYVLLNSLFLLVVRDQSYSSLFSILNPVLLFFLSTITVIYSERYEKKELLYAATVYFSLNFLFSLMGVVMNNG